jgi:hypothetical protein
MSGERMADFSNLIRSTTHKKRNIFSIYPVCKAL